MGVFGGIEWAVHETEKKNHKAMLLPCRIWIGLAI